MQDCIVSTWTGSWRWTERTDIIGPMSVDCGMEHRAQTSVTSATETSTEAMAEFMVCNVKQLSLLSLGDGWQISSSLRAVGWRPSVADWGGGMAASCFVDIVASAYNGARMICCSIISSCQSGTTSKLLGFATLSLLLYNSSCFVVPCLSICIFSLILCFRLLCIFLFSLAFVTSLYTASV